MARLSSVNGEVKHKSKQLNSLPRTGLDEATDIRRWRLLDEAGRQTWHYLGSDEELAAWPQSIADKYFLNLPTVYILHIFPAAPRLLIEVDVGFTRSTSGYDPLSLCV